MLVSVPKNASPPASGRGEAGGEPTPMAPRKVTVPAAVAWKRNWKSTGLPGVGAARVPTSVPWVQTTWAGGPARRLQLPGRETGVVPAGTSNTVCTLPMLSAALFSIRTS